MEEVAAEEGTAAAADAACCNDGLCSPPYGRVMNRPHHPDRPLRPLRVLFGISVSLRMVSSRNRGVCVFCPLIQSLGGPATHAC